jgi:ERCC4-type nuclease
MKKVSVDIDNREKDLLPFPDTVVWSPVPFRREIVQIETVVTQLPFGDYRLTKHPKLVVVERKKNLGELATNILTKDKVRFRKAWHRFVTGCEYPVLLIEQSFGQMKLPPRLGKINAEEVMAELFQLVFSTPNLVTIWAHSTKLNRKVVAANLIRMMLSMTQRRR